MALHISKLIQDSEQRDFNSVSPENKPHGNSILRKYSHKNQGRTSIFCEDKESRETTM